MDKNDEILNLLDIKQSVFEKTLNIIFDILVEMYETGLANVESNRDDTDLCLKYTNSSIEILKRACSYEVTKAMLELSYIKIVKENDPTLEQLYELTIIKHLIPYIQESNIKAIVEFQDYFCYQDTIFKNCERIKKYVDIEDHDSVSIWM